MSRQLPLTIGSLFGLLIILFIIDDAEAVDLEPINFTMNPDFPVSGEAIQITFEVVNHDVDPASNVDIIVWNSTSECDVDDNCIPIFETTVAVVSQDKKAEIDFSCEPQGDGGCGGTGDTCDGWLGCCGGTCWGCALLLSLRNGRFRLCCCPYGGH